LVAESLDLFLRELFDAHEFIQPASRPNELVQLGLDRRAIPVLSILNKEDHQECDDCR
jgi:hypothetical protein